MRKKSHELQWLEIMNQRNGLNEEEIKIYQRLKRGYQGELEFDKMCDFFLENKLDVMDDLTLHFQNNTIQIDKLIMSENTLYLIDIKYYRGHYIFEKNEWRVGQRILSNNIFEQLRRAVRVVQNIVHEADLKMNIKGVLVFINPKSSIEVIDAVHEEVMSYDQVSSWLMKMNNNNADGNPQWKNILRMFEIENYRTTRACDEQRFKDLKKGIRCTNCGSFDVEEGWYKIACSCGYVEIRETAYVRTICEYGVIMHDKDIKKKDLKTFFKNYKDDYLKRMLAKHFTLKVSKGSKSEYSNKGELNEYWFDYNRDYFEHIIDRKNWKLPL